MKRMPVSTQEGARDHETAVAPEPVHPRPRTSRSVVAASGFVADPDSAADAAGGGQHPKPMATVGQTTTLSCQHMTTVPAPLSGDTYASGCPAITPDEQRTLTLVAN